jgi:hypothetical protein
MARLRSAYQAYDIEGLYQAVRDSLAAPLQVRIVFRAIESFYPLSKLLAIAGELDRAIGRRGLHAGCRQVMARYVDCTLSVDPRAAEVMSDAAVIFYGNHPSMLTPFLMAGSVAREDLRFVSTDYVRHLIPRLREYSFPIERSLTKVANQVRRGGITRWMVGALLSCVHPVLPREESRTINRRSLGAAADYVRGGGSVFICPDGGGKRLRHWYPGIGVLIKSAMESSRPVYLIPLHERNSSNHRVTCTLLSGPIAWTKRKFFYRRPVVLEFAAPIRLDKAAVQQQSPLELTAWLRTHYFSAFGKASSSSAA